MAIPTKHGWVVLAEPVALVAAATALGIIVIPTLRRRPVPAPAPTLPVISFSTTSASQSEGNSGSVNFVFSVVRTGDLSGSSSADWAVVGSGANPASAADFVGGSFPSGMVSFAGGDASKTITVQVAGDAAAEPNEGFTVTLSSPVNATLGLATASGAIINDDAGLSLDAALTPPTVSLANAANAYPPQLYFDFTDAAAQSGDSLAVRKSVSYPPTSGNSTIARVLLTDTIISSGAFSFSTDSDTPTFLSAITSPAQTFFNCFVEHGSTYGPDSNTIKHGDTTAPTITTTSPTAMAENQPVVANLVLSEPVTVTSITGLHGALLTVAETSASATLTVKLISGLNLNYEAQTSYSYTLNVADLAGNTASFAMVANVSDQDEQPNSFTFTDQINATPGADYTAPAITVAGLGAGVGGPVVVTGGLVSINGGAFTATPPNVQNGDTVQPKGTASGSYSTAVNVVVSIGDPAVSDTFTITTGADPSRAGFVASTSQPAAINNNYSSAVYTFTTDFQAGQGAAVYIPPYLTNATAASTVKIKGAGAGGADISLVSRLTASSGPYQAIWCTADGVTLTTGGTLQVEVTLNAVDSKLAILCGSLSNASSTVPVAHAELVATGSPANPVTASASVTLASTDVGVAFATLTGGPPITANSGTLLATGLNNYSNANDNGGISRQTATGAWTASFNEGVQAGCGMLVAVWRH